MKKSRGEKSFQMFNVAFMALLMIVTAYPFYYVICASLSSTVHLQAHPGLLLAPIHTTVGAYKLAFGHPLLLSGYKNTMLVLVAALPINLLLTLLCGYFLSCKDMVWKKLGVGLVMFTMFFGGGLIPGYLNVKSLGLHNSLWALILPGAMSVYNAIIVKTALEAIPESLAESANIDGANDIIVLFRILMPLIGPTMAVMVLFYGVGHWNSWFSASIYITDNYKMPLQAIMRSILIENNDVLGGGADAAMAGDRITNDFTETIKYAVIIIATVPILCIYPFLQKYFVKGVMIGAVKG